jgi:PX domain
MMAGISQWQVHKRYREFSELHKALNDELQLQGSSSTLPALPSKRIFGSSVSPDFVQDRRIALQSYLRKLCSCAELWRSSTLVMFLDVETSMLGIQAQISGTRWQIVNACVTLFTSALLLMVLLYDAISYCQKHLHYQITQ